MHESSRDPPGLRAGGQLKLGIERRYGVLVNLDLVDVAHAWCLSLALRGRRMLPQR
jgi:hypothetical protein